MVAENNLLAAPDKRSEVKVFKTPASRDGCLQKGGGFKTTRSTLEKKQKSEKHPKLLTSGNWGLKFADMTAKSRIIP